MTSRTRLAIPACPAKTGCRVHAQRVAIVASRRATSRVATGPYASDRGTLADEPVSTFPACPWYGETWWCGTLPAPRLSLGRRCAQRIIGQEDPRADGQCPFCHSTLWP